MYKGRGRLKVPTFKTEGKINIHYQMLLKY